MRQAPALATQITPTLSGITLTSAWPDRTNERIFVITVTVQTPLDILFVSGPPLALPKQVVPHEVDCGRISATMCASKRIHVRLRVPARLSEPICAHVCVQNPTATWKCCTSWLGFPRNVLCPANAHCKMSNTSWTTFRKLDGMTSRCQE